MNTKFYFSLSKRIVFLSAFNFVDLRLFPDFLWETEKDGLDKESHLMTIQTITFLSPLFLIF